eukprot:755360-Hanusia_phi.AAC.3
MPMKWGREIGVVGGTTPSFHIRCGGWGIQSTAGWRHWILSMSMVGWVVTGKSRGWELCLPTTGPLLQRLSGRMVRCLGGHEGSFGALELG